MTFAAVIYSLPLLGAVAKDNWAIPPLRVAPCSATSPIHNVGAVHNAPPWGVSKCGTGCFEITVFRNVFRKCDRTSNIQVEKISQKKIFEKKSWKKSNFFSSKSIIKSQFGQLLNVFYSWMFGLSNFLNRSELWTKSALPIFVFWLTFAKRKTIGTHWKVNKFTTRNKKSQKYRFFLFQIRYQKSIRFRFEPIIILCSKWKCR